MQIWPASQTPWFQPLRVRPASIPRLDVGRWTLGLPGSSEQLMGVNLGSHVGQARLLWHAQVLLAHKQGGGWEGGRYQKSTKTPRCWVLLVSAGWALLISAGFCKVVRCYAEFCWVVLLGSAGLGWVLLCSARFCWVLPVSAVFCCALLRSAGLCWLGSAELCWALLGCAVLC